MFSVLVALWLLFGFNQGAEHRLAAHSVELRGQTRCSVSAETGDDPSKPRQIETSWGMIKRIYYHG
jgi:hypothetical protein